MTFARNKRLFLAAPVVALAWMGTAAAADFTFENLRIQQPGKDGTVTIKSIDVKGSNLSREEFARLTESSTPQQEAIGLIKKLQAERISIPEIMLSGKGDTPGAIYFRGYEVTKINQGRFARFAMAGMEGKFIPEKDGGEVSLKSGPLVIEDGDFAKLIDAAIAGNLIDATARVGKMDFRDFEFSFPEKGPAGPLIHSFRIGLYRHI